MTPRPPLKKSYAIEDQILTFVFTQCQYKTKPTSPIVPTVQI